MSKDKLTDAIGGIGDDLIVAAKKSRNGIIVFRRIAAAAACLVILMGAFYMLLPRKQPDPINPVLQNTTAPTIVPTTRPTELPTTVAPSVPTTVRPTSSSTKPINSRPTASTTLSFATAPTTPPIVSSTSVAPSTSNENPFEYPPLVIWDGEKYNQLFAAAADVSVMIQHQDFMKTFGNQDKLKAFVNTLQQLPIPQAEGAVCNILEYIPDYQMLNITLQTPDGVSYSFTFELNPDRADEIRESFANRNMLLEQEWTVQGCETFKTVTEFKLLSTIFPGRYGCWVEIDGWLANFTGNNLPNNTELGDILTQLSFSDTLYWG